MFHGLTMVNFDGQTQNQMMVRPCSDGQTVAGEVMSSKSKPCQHSRPSFHLKELVNWYLKKRHFKRSKIMENGQLKTISKFVGRSKIVCDPDHIMRFIYQNGNIRLLFYLQKFNKLSIPTNVTLVS